MNRSIRASELSLHEVAENLQPVGNVDRIASPGGSESSLLLAESPGARSSEDVDVLRRDALEALHTYVVAATGYNLPRSMTLFRRVTRVLDSLLDPASERSRS